MALSSHWRHMWHLALVALVAVGTGLVSPDVSRAESGETSSTTEDSDDSDSTEGSSSHASLMKLLPNSSQMAVYVDVAELRRSKYYEELASWLQNQGSRAEALQILQKKGGIELSEDVSSVALGLPVATPSQLRNNRTSTVAIEASFEADQVRSLINETFPEAEAREVSDDLTVHAIKQSEVALMENHIVIASGSEDYRNSVWKTARAQTSSLQDDLDGESLLDRMEGRQSLWMLNRSLDSANTSGMEQLKSALITVHLNEGLKLQMMARAVDEASGQKMQKQMKTLKKQSTQNPMLSTVGAMPLASNLDISLEGSTLVAETSMTAEELETLVASMRQLIQSRMKQGNPSSAGPKMGPGGGASSLPIPNDQSSGSDSSSETSSSDESDSDSSGEKDKEGVEADFN